MKTLIFHSLEQIRSREKTVTRRTHIEKNLKPGTLLYACENCFGLPDFSLCLVIRVLSVRREYLYRIDQSDVYREGFNVSKEDFIRLFCNQYQCKSDTVITRIEFEYLETHKQMKLF